MAYKDKQKVSTNKISNIISQDYRWENLLLSVVAIVSAAFAVLILVDELTINQSVPFIGTYPKVFAGILLGVAIFGLGLVIWPFVRSSLSEFKKISWPKLKEYGLNVTRVLFFMILVTFVLFFFEYIIFVVQRALL